MKDLYLIFHPQFIYMFHIFTFKSKMSYKLGTSILFNSKNYLSELLPWSELYFSEMFLCFWRDTIK